MPWKPFFLILAAVLLAHGLTSCAAHCDSTHHSKSSCPSYERVTLPGRPDSQAKQPYETAAYGKLNEPPVLMLHDMNGPGWSSLKLAHYISESGFRVYMPNLFPGEGLKLEQSGILKAKKYLNNNPDWQVHSKRSAGLILEDLRYMVREVSRLHGGRKVAVVGNCLLGIHPFALLSETCVSKVALCQPATPVKSDILVLLGREQPCDQKLALGLSDADVTEALSALKRDPQKRIAALHYEYDPVAPMERIDQLHQILDHARLAQRMETYVLRYGDYRSHPVPGWWTEHDYSQVKRGRLFPHSTIASSKDSKNLDWFRKKLIHFLTHS